MLVCAFILGSNAISSNVFPLKNSDGTTLSLKNQTVLISIKQFVYYMPIFLFLHESVFLCKSIVKRVPINSASSTTFLMLQIKAEVSSSEIRFEVSANRYWLSKRNWNHFSTVLFLSLTANRVFHLSWSKNWFSPVHWGRFRVVIS